MNQRVKAIVLSKKKYREYDELIWLYTEEYGMLSAIIYGVKRKRSRYKGELSLFSLVYIDIKLREGLSIIYDFELLDKHIDENAVFLSYTYASQLSELIRRVIPEKEQITGLLSLLHELFIIIPTMHHPELLLPFLEQKLLPYSGSMVTLNACVSCGKTQNITGFSFAMQGLICQSCQDKLLEKDILDIDKIKLLVAFSKISITKLNTLFLTKDELIFICEFWNDIYENNLGIVLRSQKVLGSMKKLKEEVK